MLLPGYDVSKAAQVIAFFAMKEGRPINILKVTKLAYLAERESMARFDEPMCYDKFASLPEGPVPSITLNLMNGSFFDARWRRFVGARKGYNIPLARADLTISDFDHISEADLDILEHLWKRFGHMDGYALRDWTHVASNVPEWVDPEGSSNPIEHKTVYEKLGKRDPVALVESIEEFRALNRMLDEVC